MHMIWLRIFDLWLVVLLHDKALIFRAVTGLKRSIDSWTLIYVLNKIFNNKYINNSVLYFPDKNGKKTFIFGKLSLFNHV